MAKTNITTDEMYPVFMDGNYGVEVELSEAEETWVANAWEAFNAMQNFLEAKYTEAGGKDAKGFLKY